MSIFKRAQRRRIGEILVDRGMVTKDHVDEALRIQQKTNETLGAILVDMGCLTDMDITKTSVMQYQIPYIQLANYQVNEKLVQLFDLDYLHQHKIFPFDQIGDMLLCAVAEVPGDEVLGEIPKRTKRNVALYVAALSDITEHLARLAPLPEDALRSTSEVTSRKPNESPDDGKKSPEDSSSRESKTTIFEEESSEAILQALDSTWDSIFESVSGQGDSKLDDAE